MRVESKNWEDILAAQILNLDPQGEYQGWTCVYREKAEQLGGWDHCPLNQANGRKGTCASCPQQFNQRVGPDGFLQKTKHQHDFSQLNSINNICALQYKEVGKRKDFQVLFLSGWPRVHCSTSLFLSFFTYKMETIQYLRQRVAEKPEFLLRMCLE